MGDLTNKKTVCQQGDKKGQCVKGKPTPEQNSNGQEKPNGKISYKFIFRVVPQHKQQRCQRKKHAGDIDEAGNSCIKQHRERADRTQKRYKGTITKRSYIGIEQQQNRKERQINNPGDKDPAGWTENEHEGNPWQDDQIIVVRCNNRFIDGL